jgi:outer membrane protein assembly factor BamB
MWSARTDLPIYATPTVLPAADALFVAGFGSRYAALDLATGKQILGGDLPEPWHARHSGSAAHRDPYASPAVTADGDVVIGCAEHVVCLRPDGTERWRTYLGHAVRASPAALHAVDGVAVCAVNGHCVFLDARSGRERTRVLLGGKIVASPAVSGSILAVGTQNGDAFGLDVVTHRVAWRSPQGAPRDHTSFTVLPDGGFVATSTRGNVVCLDRNDGAFRWETSQLLGLSEHDPTLDTTPVAGPDGSMYCGSYSGVVYHFRFRPADGG